MTQSDSPPTRPLRHLQLASLFEGLTLLGLLGVAVPLKHLADMPQAVSMMGPMHGVAFLIYLWVVINGAAGDDWKTNDVARLLGAAFIPFGFISTLRFVKRRQEIAAAAAA